jgi:polar amino acid transport system substrate-binding protein
MQQAGMTRLQGRPIRLALAAVVLSFVATGVSTASAATLDKIKQAGKITIGYRADAKPFSFDESAGKPSGYSVELCQKVVDEMKADLGVAELAIDWVAVTPEQRFADIAQGKIDLLCGAASVTLERRKEVSFSVPIFPSGISAVLRADAPPALADVLSGRGPSGPIWRGSPAQVLNQKTFSVVKGTTGEAWLSERLASFKLDAKVDPAESYDAGVAKVADGQADVFFGDRPILMESVARSASASSLKTLDELYTYELLALALPRNDDDFRLAVDKALSNTFRSSAFHDLYVKWFGQPTPGAWVFFLQSTLPQ